MTDRNTHINELIRKIHVDDDQNSFRELIRYFYPKLYRIAYAILENKMLAEEVLNDVFFRIWQLIKKDATIKDINKYLFTSVKNNALVLLKKEKNRARNMTLSFDELLENQLEVSALSISPEKEYLTKELKEKIDIAISNLPQKCRNVFQLVKQNGLSYKQTAEKLSIKPKTVENQLAIALKKIFAELKPYLNEENRANGDHFEQFTLLFWLLDIYLS